MIFPKYGRRYLISHQGAMAFAVLTGIGPSYYQMRQDNGDLIQVSFKCLLKECPEPHGGELALEEDTF